MFRIVRSFAALALVALPFAACSSDAGDTPDGPYLEGHACGGIAGYDCPPASSCQGSCNEPDCGGACYLTDLCDASGATCPNGYVCDLGLSPAYCVPELACTTAADCASGAYCARVHLASGICTTVDPAPGDACTAAAGCPWPLRCDDGTCELFCSEYFDLCPEGWSCSGTRCAPPVG